MCAVRSSRENSIRSVSDRCQCGMENYVIVSCRPWVFHAEVKTAEFSLENARINVSDVEKKFRLTFILYKSKNCRVTLRSVDGNGWSELTFKDGAVLHVCGARTLFGQILEWWSATKLGLLRILHKQEVGGGAETGKDGNVEI